ncbi:HsdR family type I site-specific deoxyribonuclease [Aquifex pyrophilus]
MTEHQLEQLLIGWFKNNGYTYVHGRELLPAKGERESLRHVVLKKRFISSIKRLNPGLRDEEAEEVYKKVLDLESPDWNVKSVNFYRYLTEGVKINYVDERGELRSKQVRLIDFENPYNNDFLIANQFEVEFQYQRGFTRKPDFVVFVNGLPLVIGELKSLANGQNFRDAYKDHEEKKKDIPQLYAYAQILVISDGYITKVGSPTSGLERFFYWEGIESDDDVKPDPEKRDSFIFRYKGEELTSLEVLVRGLFKKERFIEYLRDFIVHETDKGVVKKIAMYHQFYAARKAIENSRKAIEGKDKRIGVVWHTQGSGKSLTMLFYTRKVLRELGNPLIIFITDRRELDEQLSKLFEKHIGTVERAESIKDLKEKLSTKRGGVLFVTIQKFSRRIGELKPINEREDIIVIADEAHRSQYRELAQNMRIVIPNASFMGFTATPVELHDRSTTAVFGNYISIYPMDKARRHGVVVPIMYESRLAKLHLTNEFIDEEFEELDEETKDEQKAKLLRKLEKIVLSSEDRLRKIAKDIVAHFNERDKEYKGKGMIVTLSRKVAVELYKKIKEIPEAPSVEVVISGSKSRDEEELKPFIRNAKQLEQLANDFKDAKKDPKLVIVVDMWLTGFDVPPLHVMYIDKPMKGHTLFQAIARVNRVYPGKPSGLIVDYIGITDDLAKALSIYASEEIAETVTDIEKIVNEMKERYDVVSSMLSGINFDPNNQLALIKAYERLQEDEERKKDYIKNSTYLEKLYKMVSHHPAAIEIRKHVNFFTKVRKMLITLKRERAEKSIEEIEKEFHELISQSIIADEPIDIFSLLGREKGELTLLDEEFIKKLRESEYKNFAMDTLAKILNDQLKIFTTRNPKRYKTITEKLKEILEKYHRRLLKSAEVIDELIKLTLELKKLYKNEKTLNLSPLGILVYDYLKDYIDDEKSLFDISSHLEEELKSVINSPDWYEIPEKVSRARSIAKIKLQKVVGYKKAKTIAESLISYLQDVKVTV